MRTIRLIRQPLLAGKRLTALSVAVCLALAALGCGGGATKRAHMAKQAPTKAAGTYHLDLFKSEPREGTAVVVLVDTSGSMMQSVEDRGGQKREKYLIARDALERIIQRTAEWRKTHPKANLQMGIYNFSSTVNEVLPVVEFDEARARGALARIPKPAGGTAIGKALESGYKALYRSGCIRKFVVCITDGENTTGPPPDWIARNLHAQTGGEVELDFVAFDTSASQFQFLKEANGHVVEASDGEQLGRQLTQIYEQRILVEKEEP
jgi:Mg-chelatase subunit ChlD